MSNEIQENLIVQSFMEGSVVGMDENGFVPEHIETQQSHLFLFPETVYKINKRSNTFFNEHFRDLSNKAERFSFYKSDFSENQYFSPNVYIGLKFLLLEDGGVTLTSDSTGAEDIVMQMKRIDFSYNLTHLLHQGNLTEHDFRHMGRTQTQQVAHYPHQPKSREDYYTLFMRRIHDLDNWIASAPDFISAEERTRIITSLTNYIENKKEYFSTIAPSTYVISLDNHSDNIFYQDKTIFFLDVYPPKEEWGIILPWMNIYRPATDIWLLQSEKYARAFLEGYEEYYGPLKKEDELFYVIYSACIQAISLANQSKDNELKAKDAVIYKNFILENFEKI
ncbi:MAG: hypothetical protein JWN49_644 [Parcubacteria group bacterium]|nr:hypothetical protein [Parcubacteria group bacterium]